MSSGRRRERRQGRGGGVGAQIRYLKALSLHPGKEDSLGEDPGLVHRAARCTPGLSVALTRFCTHPLPTARSGSFLVTWAHFSRHALLRNFTNEVADLHARTGPFIVFMLKGKGSLAE